MSERLATDAKIVLERAGYTVQYHRNGLAVSKGVFQKFLHAPHGTVENQIVVELLERAGFDGYGYPRR